MPPTDRDWQPVSGSGISLSPETECRQYPLPQHRIGGVGVNYISSHEYAE